MMNVGHIMETEITGSVSRSTVFMPQIGDIDKLYSLARDKSTGARVELAQEISSILEADVTPRESELVADVLIELMRQAEKDLRMVLSEKLSLIDNVPLRLVLQLANDEIDIARPMLVNSNVLGDHDLVYIIKSKTTEYWQAIATRNSLSDMVIDVLADTKDFDTALNLCENNDIKLTTHTLSVLSDIAQGSDIMALPLLKRSEVPKELALALYNFVGEGLKQYIEKNYDARIQEATSSALNSSLKDLSAIKEDELTGRERLIRDVRQAKEKGLLNVKAMLESLRRNHDEGFIVQFSIFADLPCNIVEEMVSQKSGQGLALACKAFGVEKQDFVSIYMLTTQIWCNGAMLHPDQVKKATEYYDKATQDIALKIIRSSVKARLN